MMKKIILTLALSTLALGLQAQSTRTIKGAVVDKNGAPIIGALIEGTGSAESTQSASDGSFTIEVPYHLKKLQASYAGYRKNTKSIKGNDLLFELKPKSKQRWFVSSCGSLDFIPNHGASGGVGVMGGLLGNWGFYTRIIFNVHKKEYETVYSTTDYENWTGNVPRATAGVIKQIKQSPWYLYLGLGYAPIKGGSNYWGYDYDYQSGIAEETGVIYRFGHWNAHLGLTFGQGFDDTYTQTNYSMLFGFGYTF